MSSQATLSLSEEDANEGGGYSSGTSSAYN